MNNPPSCVRYTWYSNITEIQHNISIVHSLIHFLDVYHSTGMTRSHEYGNERNFWKHSSHRWYMGSGVSRFSPLRLLQPPMIQPLELIQGIIAMPTVGGFPTCAAVHWLCVSGSVHIPVCVSRSCSLIQMSLWANELQAKAHHYSIFPVSAVEAVSSCSSSSSSLRRVIEVLFNSLSCDRALICLALMERIVLTLEVSAVKRRVCLAIKETPPTQYVHHFSGNGKGSVMIPWGIGWNRDGG